MTKTTLKRVKSKDKYFDRLGGFVDWNKISADAGYKVTRQLNSKKNRGLKLLICFQQVVGLRRINLLRGLWLF